MNSLLLILVGIPGIIIATTLHEFTRALVSTSFGDVIPKNEGRLTLNPIKHFEPIGFILMLATGFGWGKPVSTSALYYKDRKRDTLITAIAPTMVNLIAGFVFMLLTKLSTGMGITLLTSALLYTSHYNICMVAYNIAPISPMDCTKVLSVVMPSNSYFKYIQYEKVIQMAFLFLMFMGITSPIFSPIINGISALFEIIIF